MRIGDNMQERKVVRTNKRKECKELVLTLAFTVSHFLEVTLEIFI